MDQPTGTAMRHCTSAADTKLLVAWFMEAYEDDWRPRIHTPRMADDLYKRLERLHAAKGVGSG